MHRRLICKWLIHIGSSLNENGPQDEDHDADDMFQMCLDSINCMENPFFSILNKHRPLKAGV